MDLALTLRNDLLARTGGVWGGCAPLEKPDFLFFVLFLFFKWKLCHLVKTFGCKYKNRRWEKIYVRSNMYFGRIWLVKILPKSQLFFVRIYRKFLKISQKTFKINHQKSANFIINYINARHSLNHRFRKILIGDKRSECMFAWVQRAGSLPGVA